MKKFIKRFLIVVGVIVGIILLDSIQALVFDNNPIIGIQTRNMKKIGILVDTHHCGNGKHDTVIKGFSYSCNYEGGNYTLVDETKKIKDFACAEALEGFYKDDTYTYYWSCIKNKYMIVKYDDGSKELISEALKNNHIDIQILDKFDIDYIKEENIITLYDVNTKIQEYFGKEDIDRSNLGYNYVDEKAEVVVVGLIDNSPEKQDEFMHSVFSSCCGSTYIKYVQSKSMIKFVKSAPITTSNH